MGRIFGTDGVRGVANRDLTAELALDLSVAAGLASSGVDVLDAGVIPTPATAYLVGAVGADFGVMVSASHNPAPASSS